MRFFLFPLLSTSFLFTSPLDTDLDSFIHDPIKFTQFIKYNNREIINFALHLQNALEFKYNFQPDIVQAIMISKQTILDYPELTDDYKNQVVAILDRLSEEFQVTQCGFKWFCESKDKELELPEKMAAGVACLLGGGLLFLVPGCQEAGLTLMGTGAALVLDGMAEGERPYYIDPKTGQRINEPQ